VNAFVSHDTIFINYVGGTGRVINQVCVYKCVKTITYEVDDFWCAYLPSSLVQAKVTSKLCCYGCTLGHYVYILTHQMASKPHPYM